MFVIFVPKEHGIMRLRAPLPAFAFSALSWWLQWVFQHLCRVFVEKIFFYVALLGSEKFCGFFSVGVVFRWLLPRSVSIVDFYLLLILFLEMGRTVWLFCFSNRAAVLSSSTFILPPFDYFHQVALITKMKECRSV